MSMDLAVRSLAAWSIDDTLAARSGLASLENTLIDNMLGAKAFPDAHGDYSARFVVSSNHHPDVRALLDAWRGHDWVVCQ
eukprot:1459754-Alexandrium_andersonii.AAC.1